MERCNFLGKDFCAWVILGMLNRVRQCIPLSQFPREHRHSTAAADGASNIRPHRPQPSHYYSVLCTLVHMCMYKRNRNRQRGGVSVYMAGCPHLRYMQQGVCCFVGEFKYGEHNLRKSFSLQRRKPL